MDLEKMNASNVSEDQKYRIEESVLVKNVNLCWKKLSI